MGELADEVHARADAEFRAQALIGLERTAAADDHQRTVILHLRPGTQGDVMAFVGFQHAYHAQVARRQAESRAQVRAVGQGSMGWRDAVGDAFNLPHKRQAPLRFGSQPCRHCIDGCGPRQCQAPHCAHSPVALVISQHFGAVQGDDEGWPAQPATQYEVELIELQGMQMHERNGLRFQQPAQGQ